MMGESIVFEKSQAFSVRIVKLYRYLADKKHETVMSKQILRSGTSIGANLAEAVYAVSRADFFNKASIALKETNETLYWIKLLKDSGYITQTQFNSISKDATEILKLLISITRTIKANR